MMAKKSLDPNLAAILDSIRATVGSDAPSDAPAETLADAAPVQEEALAAPAVAARPTAPAAALPAGPPQTVEQFLADLIRPQVKAWLDARLPELVQQITAEEIARIIDRQ